MATINPYLSFNGNTEEAFNFYKSVFGGEFIALQRFKDTPEAVNISLNDQKKIVYVSLSIGKGNILMASDALESKGQKVIDGNNFSISVDAESEEEATKLFKGLSEGGKINIPLDKPFWGAYFGICTDKFGVKWVVNYNYK